MKNIPGKTKKLSNILKSENGFFEIQLKINGEIKSLKVKSNEFLLDALRRCGWGGAKKGCDTGDCGSCAVLMNGKAVLSCLTPAVKVHMADITTIEGMGTVEKPHPIQEAFVETGAVQCGFCIPGMILAAKDMLDRNPAPDEDMIKHALDGNLCRCTGYVKQIEAVKLAARKLKGIGDRV